MINPVFDNYRLRGQSIKNHQKNPFVVIGVDKKTTLS